MTNLCLVDTFGTNINLSESKNKQAQTIFKIVQKFIKTLTKSGQFKAIFDKQVLEAFGKAFKVKNSPQHWWSLVEESIVGILVGWKQLEVSAGMAGVLFPLAGYWQVLIEWRLIINKLRAIQKLSQSMVMFVANDVYIRMALMFENLLDVTRQLLIPDLSPLAINYLPSEANKPAVLLSAEHLDPSST